MTRRLALIGLLSAFVWLRCAFPARAQLAQSFYNITAISTKPLPNGVQVTIETDGTVEWGVDRKEFLDIPPGQDWGPPRLLTAFRLRFVGARAAVSAYNTIGIYPVDAAEVALGQDELDGQPAFSQGRDRSRGNPAIPRVDITFRLFVPVRVSRLTFRYGGYNPWVMDDDRYVGPREVGIESSPDRRSLILTFITDRNDTLRGEPRLHRSPAEGQSHRLTVTGAAKPASPLRIEALHTPLREIAAELSRASGTPLSTAADAADIDISLVVPSASNISPVLAALQLGCDISSTPLPTEEGGGFLLSRGVGGVAVNERIPLHYIDPESARLLLPDFLLPNLRVDPEHHALIASGSPALVARLRRDLALLDLPAPLVRVEVQVYELQGSAEERHTLQASLVGRHAAFDTGAGTASVTVQPGQGSAYSAALEALVARGRARLVAKPYLVAVSGRAAQLFLGQTRFLTVLQNDGGGGQNVSVLQLPIGTTLAVTPTVSGGEGGEDGEITLDLSPQVSTVDSVQAKTGLPTVGTRQVHSVVRLRSGDTLLIAGLESVSDSWTHRRVSPLSRIPILGWLFRSREASVATTSLAVLVTARRIDGAVAATAADLPRPEPAVTPQTPRSSS